MLRSIIYGLLILLSIETFSQRPEIQFDRISVREGLSDHSINCITQDHTGFIWIGGSNGLYKYDGYDFTYYQYKPGDIRNQYFKNIYRIKEDRNGLLWIVSEIGIIVFDPGQGRSFLLDIYSNEKSSAPFSYSPDIFIDSDENIWATYRNGLIKISCSDDLRKSITDEIPFIPEEGNVIKTEIVELPFSDSGQGNVVTRIYEDRNKNLLFGCVSGVYFLEKKKGLMTRLSGGTENETESGFKYVRSIVQANDNSYWIAAGNFLYNLPEIDSVPNNIISDFLMPGIKKYTISQAQIPISLLVDKNDNILVGTDMEIFRIIKDKKNDRVSFNLVASTENDPEYYGYTKTIRDIFEDRSGVIWTAQDYYGITRFNLNGSQFNSYRNLIIKNFKNTDINPLYKDNEGNLWIGTYGGGLYKIQKNNFITRHYEMFLQKNNILCLAELTPGLFWIGTDRGLVEFDASEGRSKDPPYNALKVINRSEIYIWDILKDKDLIYIATSEGLFFFNLNTGVLLHNALVKNDSVTERRNTIFSLLKLKSGEILAGTSTQGIFRINNFKSDPEITQIADNKLLANRGINLAERHRLFEDSSGTIWIADYSGLHSLNPATSEITDYKLFENNNFPVAWSITEDDNKNLWIGTHFGLCCLDKTSGKVKTYAKESGLPVIIHGLNSVFKDRDGKLYFGGIGGFYDFYPDSLKVNNSVPPVVITDVLLFNRSIKEGDSEPADLTTDTHSFKSLKFRYNQNDLSFKFSALDYNKPSDNQYLYKLEGYQDQWIKSDANNRIVNYLKLKPGTYTFRVKGSNSYGVWNEEGASLGIIIREPWWTTWPAWIGYLLVTFSAITGIFRWRLYRLSRERQELENLVAIRTREIREQSLKISEQKDILEQQNKKIREEEELKRRFFSNIAHEIRTPLSLIKSPAEELLDNPRIKEKERSKLGMITRNAQRLLNLVNQLLDLSKFAANKMTLEICEGNVMKHLNNITVSFSSVAETKSIDFQSHFDYEKVITWFDHDKIEKIATNLLSNAFKFTPIGGEIEFLAKYGYDKNSDVPTALEFSVKDNGPGIPKQSLDKIFDRFYQVEETLKTENAGTGIGLSLSRELARLMHGDITVQSKLHSGSTFTVRLPLGKSHLAENEYTVVTDQLRESKTSGDPDKAFDGADTEKRDIDHEKGKPVILIVDDSQDLRNQLSDNLEPEYNVSVAVDGVAGLKKALEIVPDLIITDLMMPKMDGMELSGKLKENEITSHIPIIILTARDTPDDKIAGFQTGADDYIAKPFSMPELKVRVANLIDQRMKLRERFGREITLEPQNITITPADEKFITRAIAAVEKHIKDEQFNLAVFRHEMNLSRSTLSRKLAALTGQSL